MTSTQQGPPAGVPASIKPGAPLPEAVLTIFCETNEHERNAEQKQLTITAAYLGMIAVVLSLLPWDITFLTFLKARVESAVIYGFMLGVGCCVYLLQTWCRASAGRCLINLLPSAVTVPSSQCGPQI